MIWLKNNDDAKKWVKTQMVQTRMTMQWYRYWCMLVVIQNKH